MAIDRQYRGSNGLGHFGSAPGASHITAIGALDHADRHCRHPGVDRGHAANPSIAKGLTQQFTATGTYTDNSTQNLTTR